MNLLEFYSLRFYCLSFFSLYHQNFIIQKLLQRSLEKNAFETSYFHNPIIFSLSTHLTNAALYAEHSSDFHSPAIVVRKLTYVF